MGVQIPPGAPNNLDRWVQSAPIYGSASLIVIGLVSWLVQNYQSAETLLIYGDVVLIVVLVITLILIHRKILSDIKRLKEL